MKITLDLDITPRQKRLLRIMAAAGIFVGFCGVGVALAAVPHSFANGTPLSAQTMNENFAYLDQKVRVVGTVNGRAFSSGVTKFVGATPASYNAGEVGTYAGGKDKCEAAFNSSAPKSAHMCSADELGRSLSAGLSVPLGWYQAPSGGASDYHNSRYYVTGDCSGWTDGMSDINGFKEGAAFIPPEGFGHTYCSVKMPILCCD